MWIVLLFTLSQATFTLNMYLKVFPTDIIQLFIPCSVCSGELERLLEKLGNSNSSFKDG